MGKKRERREYENCSDVREKKERKKSSFFVLNTLLVVEVYPRRMLNHNWHHLEVYSHSFDDIPS